MLTKALKALEDKVGTLNVSAVLQQEQKSLNKAVGKEHLQVMLETFLTLAEHIEAVEESHACILRMHNARNAK